MMEFRFEDLDISTTGNETIAALGEILWEITSGRSEEEVEIDRKYEGTLENLLDSFSPEQHQLFEQYQAQTAEKLALAEQRRFICGFKVGTRLAFEGLNSAKGDLE